MFSLCIWSISFPSLVIALGWPSFNLSWGLASPGHPSNGRSISLIFFLFFWLPLSGAADNCFSSGSAGETVGLEECSSWESDRQRLRNWTCVVLQARGRRDQSLMQAQVDGDLKRRENLVKLGVSKLWHTGQIQPASSFMYLSHKNGFYLFK